MQLYFDFSGCSDMALGIALMFGVRLPLNFNSPYKATSITDFWRRWHMTLSRFLRDYLYISLGGNRRGKVRRYVNLMITMLLGGLWHGASWQFMLWGGLHGAYLCVNHAWRVVRGVGDREVEGTRVGRIAGRLLTFVAVLFSWVYFRAPTMDSANAIVQGMLGLNGVSLLPGLAGPLAPLAGAGVTFQGWGTFAVAGVPWIIGLLAVCWLAPNSQELLADARPALERVVSPWRRLRWRPSPAWAAAAAVVGAHAFLSLARVSEFLYFQF